VVVGLALEGKFDEDLAVVVNFEEARLLAGFGEEDVAVVERLDTIHFALGAFELEEDLVVLIEDDNCAAGVVLGLGGGQENVAAGQDQPSRELPG